MEGRARALAAFAGARSFAVLAVALLAVASACGADDGEAPLASEPVPGDAAPAADADGAPAPDAGGAPAPGAQAPEPPTGTSQPDPAALRVWFMLDPRVTGGAYMGERWVSPDVFHASPQVGATFTIEAMAPSPRGEAAEAISWSSPAGGIVTLSPAHGARTTIEVLRAGQTTISVTDGERSTTVHVDAIHEAGVWSVRLSQ